MSTVRNSRSRSSVSSSQSSTTGVAKCLRDDQGRGHHGVLCLPEYLPNHQQPQFAHRGTLMCGPNTAAFQQHKSAMETQLRATATLNVVTNERMCSSMARVLACGPSRDPVPFHFLRGGRCSKHSEKQRQKPMSLTQVNALLDQSRSSIHSLRSNISNMSVLDSQAVRSA